ncbi:MAG: hypothetical protein AAF677_16485, partial [Pseudomonadota bacterium]
MPKRRAMICRARRCILGVAALLLPSAAAAQLERLPEALTTATGLYTIEQSLVAAGTLGVAAQPAIGAQYFTPELLAALAMPPAGIAPLAGGAPAPISAFRVLPDLDAAPGTLAVDVMLDAGGEQRTVTLRFVPGGTGVLIAGISGTGFALGDAGAADAAQSAAAQAAAAQAAAAQAAA